MAPETGGEGQPEESADGGVQSGGAAQGEQQPGSPRYAPTQSEEPEQALEYEIAKLFERLEAEEH